MTEKSAIVKRSCGNCGNEGNESGDRICGANYTTCKHSKALGFYADDSTWAMTLGENCKYYVEPEPEQTAGESAGTIWAAEKYRGTHTSSTFKAAVAAAFDAGRASSDQVESNIPGNLYGYQACHNISAVVKQKDNVTKCGHTSRAGLVCILPEGHKFEHDYGINVPALTPEVEADWEDYCAESRGLGERNTFNVGHDMGHARGAAGMLLNLRSLYLGVTKVAFVEHLEKEYLKL